MPDPETRITDRNEVAALIGVVANTLPEGPCVAQRARLDYKYSGLYGIDETSYPATAFTWQDGAGAKILEVKVPEDKDLGLRYQRTQFDAKGQPDTREEFYSGKRPASKTWYYDNGQIAQANYGTDFGSSPARHIVKYDREGKLHSVKGYADFILVDDGIYSGTYRGSYHIHGQGYNKAEFKKHPEYLAAHGLSAFVGSISAGLKGLFNGNANDGRKAALPVEALIAEAAKLSPDDKDRLAAALGGDQKKAISFKL